MDDFEIKVDTTLVKFKRLMADQEVFRSQVVNSLGRSKEIMRVMRAEQLAMSKITSTLVELEFIQQSLDFQDEFDKTQMNLYGLNDLNMTLSDFINKSSEIAERMVNHEAMRNSNELDKLDDKGVTKGGNFELTNSGTYQAIQMSDDWKEHMDNEHLQKQVQ